MGCSTCGGGGVGRSNAPVIRQQPQQQRIINTDCQFSKQLLTTWLNALTCVKTNNKLSLITVPDVLANQFLGVLISALNYPEDYCYYESTITNFQNNILPRIVEHVPECLS